MKLRFTGEFPPPEYPEQHPNWANAYDEESVEGQNETTLKPHDQQSYIDEEVSFTAGEVLRADGAMNVALIEVIAAVPQAVYVFGGTLWGVALHYPEKRWDSLRQDWIPAEERMKAVSLDDASVFPLQVASRLPKMKGGERIRFEIKPDGSAKDIT